MNLEKDGTIKTSNNILLDEFKKMTDDEKQEFVREITNVIFKDSNGAEYTIVCQETLQGFPL